MTKSIGNFYMAMNAGDHTNKKENAQLTISREDMPPKNSGHQDGNSWIVSGGGDSSNLNPGDLPPGISIKCHGSDSDGWGWAVVKPYHGFPILTVSEFDQDYNPVKFVLTLGLYLHCDNQFSGGGNVRVDIYSSVD